MCPACGPTSNMTGNKTRVMLGATKCPATTRQHAACRWSSRTAARVKPRHRSATPAQHVCITAVHNADKHTTKHARAWVCCPWSMPSIVRCIQYCVRDPPSCCTGHPFAHSRAHARQKPQRTCHNTPTSLPPPPWDPSDAQPKVKQAQASTLSA